MDKLNLSDGSFVTSFPVNCSPRGITYYSGHLWVADGTGTNAGIVELDPSTGSVLKTVGVAGNDVIFDSGGYMIEVDYSHLYVYTNSGTLLQTNPSGELWNPNSVAYYGNQLYVAKSSGIAPPLASTIVVYTLE